MVILTAWLTLCTLPVLSLELYCCGRIFLLKVNIDLLLFRGLLKFFLRGFRGLLMIWVKKVLGPVGPDIRYWWKIKKPTSTRLVKIPKAYKSRGFFWKLPNLIKILALRVGTAWGLYPSFRSFEKCQLTLHYPDSLALGPHMFASSCKSHRSGLNGVANKLPKCPQSLPSSFDDNTVFCSYHWLSDSYFQRMERPIHDVREHEACDNY